jgi:hypothetical protein
VRPEKVSNAVRPQGMQSRVAQQDFQHAPRRRVFGKDRPNVFSNCSEHQVIFLSE